MTTRVDSLRLGRLNTAQTRAIAESPLFDWAVIAVSTWLVGGLYADAWAHNHLPIDNFFTPWHAVLYSGVLVSTFFLVGTSIINRLKNGSWQRVIPVGYELSVVGALLFVCSGIGDLIWHQLFGIELSIDAALSPTHLGIVVSAALIVSGPFRAAWHRSRRASEASFISQLPMLLSLTFTLAVITVIAQWAHPFVHLWPSDSVQVAFGNQAFAVVSMVLQTLLLMGLVLITIRRWTLPLGSLTLVFTLNIALLSLMQNHYQVILAAMLAGLMADLLIQWLKPSVERPEALRIFAFLVPMIFSLCYFLSLAFTTGISWSIHLWLGSTVVTGITGWLMSYLLVPPVLPAERDG